MPERVVLPCIYRPWLCPVLYHPQRLTTQSVTTADHDETRPFHLDPNGSMVNNPGLVVANPRRGHIRPLLHLSLNILVVHPGLHLTLLLAPSVVSQVKSELASPACAHIKVSSEDGVQPVTERLQVVEVRSAHFSLPEQFTPATMAQEAMDFAGILPAFLEALVVGKAKIGETNVSNKLAQFPPSFIIYDVSNPTQDVGPAVR